MVSPEDKHTTVLRIKNKNKPHIPDQRSLNTNNRQHSYGAQPTTLPENSWSFVHYNDAKQRTISGFSNVCTTLFYTVYGYNSQCHN